jgi:hypothetical protein
MPQLAGYFSILQSFEPKQQHLLLRRQPIASRRLRLHGHLAEGLIGEYHFQEVSA